MLGDVAASNVFADKIGRYCLKWATMQTATLSAKQTRFVSEYLVDGNGAQAAIRAGYSARSAKAIAAENLTKPDVQKALQAHQSADAARLCLRREDVLAGLLEAVDQARVQSNPAAMVSGLREIGKMLGFYAPEVKKVDLNVAGQVELKRMNQMSDAELLAIIEAGQAA